MKQHNYSIAVRLLSWFALLTGLMGVLFFQPTANKEWRSCYECKHWWKRL